MEKGEAGEAPALLRALMHRSAWKVNSAKLNFRFTEFSEVRYTLAMLKQQQRYDVWAIRRPSKPC